MYCVENSDKRTCRPFATRDCQPALETGGQLIDSHHANQSRFSLRVARTRIGKTETRWVYRRRLPWISNPRQPGCRRLRAAIAAEKKTNCADDEAALSHRKFPLKPVTKAPFHSRPDESKNGRPASDQKRKNARPVKQAGVSWVKKPHVCSTAETLLRSDGIVK
jgi:hypothetical protein